MWYESNQINVPLEGITTDVVFNIRCTQLPVDHAAKLAEAVCNHAPIILSSANAGIHAIHVAGSQNGWERPVEDDQPLILSKRTRLQIRIEKTNAEELIRQLSENDIAIDGHPLTILHGKLRMLKPAPTLIARHTFFDNESNENEQEFIDKVIQQCRQIDFEPSKILCGRVHQMKTPHGRKCMRSVLLADVPPTASLKLQDSGLGLGRRMGCGIPIPHKDTAAVNDGVQDTFH